MAKKSPLLRSHPAIHGLLFMALMTAFVGLSFATSGAAPSEVPGSSKPPNSLNSLNSRDSLDSLDSPDSLDSLEAVLDTSFGQMVIEFFPKDAPHHVEYFVKKAREGAYDGTTFFQLVKDGLIQGGDPLTKSAGAKASYGTGGLRAGLPDEVNQKPHEPGAVSAVLQGKRGAPGESEPGSSGMQFFIVVGRQPQLDNKFSVFGRVVEGMGVASKISEQPASRSGAAAERIELKKVTIREKTPTVDQMKGMHAVIETSLGNLKLEFTPEGAPNAARSFIRHARSGIYDGTTFYRVSGKYYLEAGNLDDWPPDSPNRKRNFSKWPVPFEPNNFKPVRGTASLRQMKDGTVKLDFYIISHDNPALEGKDAPFAKVVDGLDVVDKIAEAEVDGDKPKQRIEMKRVTIE